ncbi:hypothetical protein CYMTET_50386 [Cymbomonas tetramitiformis]|uniref:Reverse transcriptase RNase H-like domain-containing protein n=1 Tax=Cymbomonas tetramitiformis TaxID=36881 RepID=A0AAE0BPD2_9CHLO|nr:hypothetical protein CYMTET_50383 [Cymbomonas tetramitiformis]KAK3239703.1 hypothetical protein CYMTET_50386 [Cymbomonas tetramitiformis]
MNSGKETTGVFHRTMSVRLPCRASGEALPERALLCAGGEAQLGCEGEDLAGGMVGSGVVVEHAARAFWSDKMRDWHITHLELEAVYKTVQAFLRELEGKVVRLYCDNQAVVAMLSHFTSRNPDLMRRMRRLWSFLDLHDIELAARYICSKANVWGPTAFLAAKTWTTGDSTAIGSSGPTSSGAPTRLLYEKFANMQIS